MSEAQPCTAPPPRPSLAGLERCWARGLMSNEELLGYLLRYLIHEERQEPRTKNQEPGAEQNQEPGEQNQEPGGQNQEPRTKNRGHEADGEERIHEGHEGHEDPEIGKLLAQNAELKTQNSKLKTQLLGLTRLLWQFGDTIDVLAGEELELWEAEGLWFWHWQDTGELALRGLRTHGEALVNAVEHRAGLLVPE
ncbi:MAG: hypothetical protein OHK0022_36790 [Roseiflexaceae bacterium]